MNLPLVYFLNIITDRQMDIFEGNSACQAIELLIQKGVPEAHIVFLNLISVSLLLQLKSAFVS